MNPYDIVDRLLEADLASDTERQALDAANAGYSGLPHAQPGQAPPPYKRPSSWSKEGQQLQAKDLFVRGTNASHGSMEGAPPEDPGVMNPKDIPHTPGEAKEKGTHWHVPLWGKHKNQRQSTRVGKPDAVPHYPKSEKIASKRNDRREAYGYRDRASLRDRKWPTGGQRHRPRQQPEVPLPAPPYEV